MKRMFFRKQRKRSFCCILKNCQNSDITGDYRRGFTLIELLAVIVILAIIALITVPIVLGLIEDGKKKSNEDSIYGIVAAIRYYYNHQFIKQEAAETTFSCNGVKCHDGSVSLDIDGKIPEHGKFVLYETGHISGHACYQEQCYVVKNGKVVSRGDFAPAATSIFSWRSIYYTSSYEKTTLSLLDSLHVDRVYHSFDGVINSPENLEIVKKLKEHQIDVYEVTGTPSWYRDVSDLKRKIDEVVAYNQGLGKEYPLKGINFDIEFYLTDEWDTEPEAVIAKTVETYREAAQYAHEKNISIIFCIPFWLDSKDVNALEEIIKVSDGVSVMNYNRRNMTKNIQLEVELAKKYNKHIETIGEFGAPGSEGEIVTFWPVGVKGAHEVWKGMDNAFDEPKFAYAYHDIGALLSLEKGMKKTRFYFKDSAGNAVTEKEIIIYLTDETGESWRESHSIRTDGTLSATLLPGFRYNIYLLDYKIISVSDKIVGESEDIVNVVIGEKKKTYTAEIYFKLWRPEENRYSSFRNATITLTSLETGETMTKTTHASDGYYALSLNYDEEYSIKVEDDKQYEWHVGSEDSTVTTLKFSEADGTYIVPKIYFKEK